jgi:hypothetical protein
MIDRPHHQFTLGIANLGIQLDCPNALIKTRLIEKYQDFVLPEVAERQVQVIIKIGSSFEDYPLGIHFIEQRMIVSEAGGVGWLACALDAGELYLAPQASLGAVDYFLRTAFALLAYQAGGFMFHTAAVVKNGEAFCFFGHSGSGKTTVARNSPPESVLNDDLVLVLPEGESWSVYGTPFTNPTQVRPSNRSAPLGGLFRLVQDQTVYLEPVSEGLAVAELISCLPVMLTDPDSSQELMRRVQKVLAKYPVQLLHFRPDSSFWPIIN